MISYTLVRSGRKTVSIEVRGDRTVLVRAPFLISKRQIDSFVMQKEKWIVQKLSEAMQKETFKAVSLAERESIREIAKQILPQRLAFWSEKTGLSYHGLTVTSAEKRFGSCNGKNHICLSLYLAEYPQELVDYVIVHELSHTVHHNHSAAFYALVERILPDWRERERELKKRPLPRLKKA